VIDFRYHLVSIIAVFFALAVGIVLGAGPLGERVDENLPEQLAEMRETNQQYQEQIRSLEARQEFRDGFIEGVTEELVAERLANRRVAVLAMPEADGDVVEEVSDLLDQAGATVTARVRVDSSWTDPESEEALDALAAELVSPGMTLPEDGTGYVRGAALLAAAIVRPPLEEVVSESLPGGVDEGTLEEASRVNQDVLSALSEAGLVEVGGAPEIKAPLAVIVAGPAPEPEEGKEDEAAAPLESLTAVVTAVADTASGTVAAGSPGATAEGGLLAAVRADDRLASRVSTVDSLDMLGGRIAVVYAVAEQADGDSGHYGYEGAADGPVPPVPEVRVPDTPRPGATEDTGSRPAEDGSGGPAGEGSQSEDDADDGTATDEEGGQ